MNKKLNGFAAIFAIVALIIGFAVSASAQQVGVERTTGVKITPGCAASQTCSPAKPAAKKTTKKRTTKTTKKSTKKVTSSHKTTRTKIKVGDKFVDCDRLDITFYTQNPQNGAMEQKVISFAQNRATKAWYVSEDLGKTWKLLSAKGVSIEDHFVVLLTYDPATRTFRVQTKSNLILRVYTLEQVLGMSGQSTATGKKCDANAPCTETVTETKTQKTTDVLIGCKPGESKMTVISGTGDDTTVKISFGAPQDCAAPTTSSSTSIVSSSTSSTTTVPGTTPTTVQVTTTTVATTTTTVPCGTKCTPATTAQPPATTTTVTTIVIVIVTPTVTTAQPGPGAPNTSAPPTTSAPAPTAAPTTASPSTNPSKPKTA